MVAYLATLAKGDRVSVDDVGRRGRRVSWCLTQGR